MNTSDDKHKYVSGMIKQNVFVNTSSDFQVLRDCFLQLKAFQDQVGEEGEEGEGSRDETGMVSSGQAYYYMYLLFL